MDQDQEYNWALRNYDSMPQEWKDINPLIPGVGIMALPMEEPPPIRLNLETDLPEIPGLESLVFMPQQREQVFLDFDALKAVTPPIIPVVAPSPSVASSDETVRSVSNDTAIPEHTPKPERVEVPKEIPPEATALSSPSVVSSDQDTIRSMSDDIIIAELPPKPEEFAEEIPKDIPAPVISPPSTPSETLSVRSPSDDVVIAEPLPSLEVTKETSAFKVEEEITSEITPEALSEVLPSVDKEISSKIVLPKIQVGKEISTEIAAPSTPSEALSDITERSVSEDSVIAEPPKSEEKAVAEEAREILTQETSELTTRVQTEVSPSTSSKAGSDVTTRSVSDDSVIAEPSSSPPKQEEQKEIKTEVQPEVHTLETDQTMRSEEEVSLTSQVPEPKPKSPIETESPITPSSSEAASSEFTETTDSVQIEMKVSESKPKRYLVLPIPRVFQGDVAGLDIGYGKDKELDMQVQMREKTFVLNANTKTGYDFDLNEIITHSN